MESPFSNFRSALEPEQDFRVEEFPDEMPELKTLSEAIIKVFSRVETAIKLAKVTESPIETMLGVALWDIIPDDWDLIPQLKWRSYRVDWCLRRPNKPDIFIECDGKDFHTAPEQMARDRRRDIEIISAGITILRFTGSEIFRDAERCALKVLREARE